MRLKDKVALVTGGASGFGAAIARHFVDEGARVVILDLNGEGAARVAANTGGAVGVAGDVTKRDDIDRAVTTAVEKFGRLDIVVNNAGWSFRNKPIMDVTEEEFDRVFAVNVKSIFHMTHAAVPVMRKQGGGCIINIGSTGGIRPRPGLTWYNGSKGAVNLLSSAMAAELAPDNIRVNCVAPVIGETAILKHLWACLTRRKTAPSSLRPFRSAACRSPTTSPRPASISRRTMPISSPVSCCRWMAGGRSNDPEKRSEDFRLS